MKRLRSMSRGELRYYLKRLSRAVEEVLPPGLSSRGKCLFALVLTDGPGRTCCVTNSRQKIRAALRTAVSRIKSRRRNRVAYIR